MVYVSLNLAPTRFPRSFIRGKLALDAIVVHCHSWPWQVDLIERTRYQASVRKARVCLHKCWRPAPFADLSYDPVTVAIEHLKPKLLLFIQRQRRNNLSAKLAQLLTERLRPLLPFSQRRHVLPLRLSKNGCASPPALPRKYASCTSPTTVIEGRGVLPPACGLDLRSSTRGLVAM